MRVRGKNKNDDDAREQIVDTFGLLDEAVEIAREIKSSAALVTTVETWVNRLIVDAKALRKVCWRPRSSKRGSVPTLWQLVLPPTFEVRKLKPARLGDLGGLRNRGLDPISSRGESASPPRH